MGPWDDFSTAALFTLLQLGTLIGLMTLVAFMRQSYAGFRHWLVALWLLAAAPATLLLFPDQAPLDGARMFVSWLPFLAAAVVAHEGVRRFRGRPSVWRVDAGIAAAGFLAAGLARSLGAPYTILLLMLSPAMVVLLLRAAATMMRGARPELRAPYAVFAAGLILMAAAIVFRALAIYFGALLDLDPVRQWAETVLFVGGSLGSTIALVGAILAGSQRREIEMLDLQQVLERQARTDPLTGLANRRQFFARVDAARAGGGEWTLILFDVDHFKHVNDDYGHDLGDLVLQRIARLLTDDVPDDATAARLGGEEFALLLPGKPATAIEFAGRALDRVRGVANERILKRPVTLSAGVARLDSEDPEASMRLADRRLYAAKRRGRDRVVAEGDGDASPEAVAVARRGPRGGDESCVDTDG